MSASGAVVASYRLGTLAVQHRERLDGSGYPRGVSGGAISLPARILGAADAYQAMGASRARTVPRVLPWTVACAADPGDAPERGRAAVDAWVGAGVDSATLDSPGER